MKFFTAISLATLATASAILPRDASTIVADVKDIATKLNAIDAAVKSFNGDTSAAISIQTQTSGIETAIEKATKDTTASAVLSEADSGTVANAILALQAPIKSALEDIVAKKAAFNKALSGAASSIIKTDLTTLQSDTDAFGKAIEAKLAASIAGAAPAILAQIDSEFAVAIKAYST